MHRTLRSNELIGSRATSRTVLAAGAAVASTTALVTMTILAGFAIALCASPALAQPRPAPAPMAEPGELSPIDERTQRAILDSVAAVLDTAYVMADQGALMIRRLRAGWNDGDWRELTDPVLFVRRLNEELHAIYDDHHLSLIAMHPAELASPPEGEDPLEGDEHRAWLRQGNFGFRKVEILPGNIGYLELTAFASTEVAGEIGVAAMNFLANADALVIDLRANGGGDASMIKLLTGYLLPQETHLINWYVRDTDETIQSWSLAYVPGKRLPDVPLWILVSQWTGSAAEEFSFDLKNLDRATLVGETTAGAGNTVAHFVFDFETLRVGMRASYGAALDPRSGQGWEGVGVVPDIAVPARDALVAAQIDILSRRRAQTDDPGLRFDADWILRDLQALLRPMTLTPAELEPYAGAFGPRLVVLSDGSLYYEREGRSRLRLEPLGDDVFRVGDLTDFRLRFGRDDSGRLDRVIGTYRDGHEDENARDGLHSD